MEAKIKINEGIKMIINENKKVLCFIPARGGSKQYLSKILLV